MGQSLRGAGGEKPGKPVYDRVFPLIFADAAGAFWQAKLRKAVSAREMGKFRACGRIGE